MKSIFLRVLSAVMALVMMICCFTACSDNTVDESTTTTTEQNQFDGFDSNGGGIGLI